jgi:hypothetical protein
LLQACLVRVHFNRFPRQKPPPNDSIAGTANSAYAFVAGSLSFVPGHRDYSLSGEQGTLETAQKIAAHESPRRNVFPLASV